MLAAGDCGIAISAFENLSFAENETSSGTRADGFTGLGNLRARRGPPLRLLMSFSPTQVVATGAVDSVLHHGSFACCSPSPFLKSGSERSSEGFVKE